MSVRDDAERRAIMDEWRRQSAAPLPADHRQVGCVLAILGATGLVAFPVLMRNLPVTVPAGVRNAALVAASVVIVAGLMRHVLGGMQRSTAIHAQVQSAVTALTSGTADAAARRAAAVTLLLRAHDSTGPATHAQYDAAAMAARLGAGLEEVRAVERVLALELPGFWRVFTTDERPAES